ncbi:MAG: hypothetical protein KDK39_08975 [Leptospiraceae bacterium]|nr:hypothetical protein [Leptospiraceae bacterium]
MQRSVKLYHVSPGKQHPLLFHAGGPLQIEVRELDTGELGTLAPDPNQLHFFLIHVSSTQLAEETLSLLKANPQIHIWPALLLMSAADYARLKARANLIPSTVAVADDIQLEPLRILVEQMLYQLHYHQLLHELSLEMRKRSTVFDRVLEMAHQELKDARAESAALKALLDFDGDMKRTADSLQAAMQEAWNWKDHEAITLREQLQMVEKLNVFREKELAQAHQTIQATEKALEMSLQENLDREKVIVAMNRLRSLSDHELMDLYNENQQLKDQLARIQN